MSTTHVQCSRRARVLLIGAFIELSVVNLVGAGHAWTAVHLFFTQRSSPSWAGALRIKRRGCDASAEGV